MNTRDTFAKAAFDAAYTAALHAAGAFDKGKEMTGASYAFKEGWDSAHNAYVGGPTPYGYDNRLAALWRAGRAAGMSYMGNRSIQNLVEEI